MNYEMMVLDLDGTLLNSASKLERRTKEALQKCMEMGKKIVLCSSRSYEEFRTIAEEVYEGCREQYCIGFGGACSYTQNGKSIAKADAIGKEVADKMITLAEDEKIHIHGYDEDLLYYYRETEAFRTFVNFAKVSHIPMQKISYEEFQNKSYLKLMCLGDREKLEKYNAVVSPDAYTAFSNPAGQQGYLDMTRAGVSKGSGVEMLCEYLGILVATCICVGDGQNDIPMLQQAGLGIAMKNGEDCVKAVADYVVPYTNDEHAIVYLAEKFLLGEAPDMFNGK